jgi:hypothetical protein
MSRRKGHTRANLRDRAALYGLEVGVEIGVHELGCRYTLEDAHGRIYGEALGMMRAEILLDGVAIGWTLLLEQGQKEAKA